MTWWWHGKNGVISQEHFLYGNLTTQHANERSKKEKKNIHSANICCQLRLTLTFWLRKHVQWEGKDKKLKWKWKWKWKMEKKVPEMRNTVICYILHMWMYEVGVLNSSTMSNVHDVRLLRKKLKRKKKKKQNKTNQMP